MVTYDCLIDSIVILVVVFEDMRYHMQHSNNWFVMDFEEQHAHGTARLHGNKTPQHIELCKHHCRLASKVISFNLYCLACMHGKQ